MTKKMTTAIARKYGGLFIADEVMKGAKAPAR